MTKAPDTETRRRPELLEELRARAKVWLPEWQTRDAPGDFLSALFNIAAGFSSEVTERLNRVPEKNFRGFLQWLGLRGDPARAARVPAVFTMSPGAAPVEALPPVQFQALDPDSNPPVMFETFEPFTVTPSKLAWVYGADTRRDVYTSAPPGMLTLEKPGGDPTEWTVIADVAAGEKIVQLDPPLGLELDLVLETDATPGVQYTITKIDGALHTLERALEAGLASGSSMRRVMKFEPFGASRDLQRHEIYFGAKTALDLPSKAVIAVDGVESIFGDGYEWFYWGKTDDPDSVSDWVKLAKDPERPGVVSKAPGAVEETQIERHKNRWIKVSLKQDEHPAEFGDLQDVRFRINCKLQAPPNADYEAIANTSPVVKGGEFYPLGREPRLFDAFYVGSKEALSKGNALATLNFTMGDEWSSNLGVAAAVTAANAKPGFAVAGINAGGALRVIKLKDLGDKTATEFLEASQPVDAQGHAVKLSGEVGFGIAASGKDLFVAAIDSVRTTCWLWHAGVDANGEVIAKKDWKNLGAPGSTTKITSIAIYPGPNGLEALLVADSAIHARRLDAAESWRSLPATFDGNDVKFVSVQPFTNPDAQPGEVPLVELAALSNTGRLYLSDGRTAWKRVAGEHVSFATDGRLLAMRDDASNIRLYAVRVSKSPNNDNNARELVLVMIEPEGDEYTIKDTPVSMGLDVAGGVVVPLTGTADASVGFVTFDKKIGTWSTSLADIDSEPPILIDVPGGNSTPSLAPVRVNQWLIVPSSRGHAWIAKIDARAHHSKLTPIHDALVVAARLEPRKRIYVAEFRTRDGEVQRKRVSRAVALAEGRYALVLPIEKKKLELDESLVLDLYKAQLDPAHRRELSDGLPATGTGDQYVVEVDAEQATDAGLVDDSRLLVSWTARGKPVEPRVAIVTKMSPVDVPSGTRNVNLDLEIPLGVDNITLWVLEHDGRHKADVLPALSLSPDSLAHDAVVHFPRLDPRPATLLRSAQPTSWVVVATRWADGPGADSKAYVVADATLRELSEISAPLARNPDLSWEYWDGSSWWRIPEVDDATSSLSMSGTVTFCVPANIAATEVVGHNNYWVRARLVGGDYGQEKVVLETDKDDPKKQTVTRSTEGIHAPFVNALTVSVEVCCPVVPELVLTFDGGGYVDQSAANRGSLTYPAIVPLWRSIEGPDRTRPRGRAVYLGFDDEISGAPVSLLLHVNERSHSDAFPLRVEALFAEGFETLVSNDGTRGLNESGTITVILPRTPLRSTLFGRVQYWIRLRPRQGFNDDEWLPMITGAWVNGTWAKATETQVEELLGSSDGRPGLVATLARPPVVAESLRLRVREPLSEEEIRAINEKATSEEDRVLDHIGSRPGPWVLWREVPDLLDSKPDAREFAFEDETGDITFGDGHSGRIPPIGRDCIIAERYVRGGGAAANRIQAFADANLATPLAGVDGVVLTAAAAGGADAQQAEEVLRFAPDLLRQRGRILTLAELESAARQHSPDIVQAFAQSRAGGVDLCIVVRGDDPRAPARTCRELARVLSERVAPHLAVRNALKVKPPFAVPLQVALEIVVDSVDNSGTVIKECTRRIHELLNAATGGLDGFGWPLGRWPTAEEIAAALDDLPHLEGFGMPDFKALDGAARSLRATDIITVSTDDIAIIATVPEGVA